MLKWEILRIAAHAVVMCVLLRDMCRSLEKRDLHDLIYVGFLFLAAVISFAHT